MAVTVRAGGSARGGARRPNNCFRCWHCRRVDGMSSCCVCVVNMSKFDGPELILEPYGGACPAFYDKKIEEDKINHEGLKDYIDLA